MVEISYRRHRFPPVFIQHAVWLYLRFTLSYRDVEELLAERGLDISYETIRRWVLKFGPVIARRLRRCRSRPSNRRHLDEMVVRIWPIRAAVGTVSWANVPGPGSRPAGRAAAPFCSSPAQMRPCHRAMRMTNPQGSGYAKKSHLGRRYRHRGLLHRTGPDE